MRTPGVDTPMGGTCGLRHLAAAWAPQIPTTFDGEDGGVFVRGEVPPVPANLSSDRLVVKRSHHEYNGYFRADHLAIYATRQTLTEWGLLLLAGVLGGGEAQVTEIHLTHGASDVTTMRVEWGGWTDCVVDMEPTRVTYWPQARRTFPWSDASAAQEAPSFFLVTGGVTDEDWAERNTVIGHGQAPAVVWLATLLLDLGNPDVGGDEFRLESEGMGYGGVAPGSAEVMFLLPGSFGWNDFGLDN